MKKIFLGFSLLMGSIFAFGQVEREVGEFSSLKIYDRITVELIESYKDKVEIIGDEDGRIEIINKNGELKIRTKTTQFLRGKDIRVKVYYDDINEIQASQGAKVISDDIIKTNAIKLIANEGSIIQLELKANQITARGNSGGKLNLEGEAKTQDVIISSGAVFGGKNLEGESITILVTAGGKAEINTSDSVKATVRAGGNVDIYGNPKNRNVKKIIGGNINFK